MDPVQRRAGVYRADGSESVVTEHDALEGGDVVPGLIIPLAAVL